MVYNRFVVQLEINSLDQLTIVQAIRNDPESSHERVLGLFNNILHILTSKATAGKYFKSFWMIFQSAF